MCHSIRQHRAQGALILLAACGVLSCSDGRRRAEEVGDIRQALACFPPELTTRISVATQGFEANQSSAQPAVSADGRFVAFGTNASNLIAGDTNEANDIYLRDVVLGDTSRVSVAADGSEADGSSFQPVVSTDARFVAFTSTASNLVPGDSNGQQDIFVRDRAGAITARISVATSGAQANGLSNAPSISADGRLVAFSSGATNLVGGDSNGQPDIFVRDRTTNQTTRASVASGGAQGNGASSAPALSADGRFVVFVSDATNLVAGDTNRQSDVFVRDRATNQTTRASLSSGGGQANGGSFFPGISRDGRFVVFSSVATNLGAGDTNGASDVFVRDRATNRTTRVSVGTGGGQGNDASIAPSIGADGRLVAFLSFASNLVPGDTNGNLDVFVRDRTGGQTIRASLRSDGGQANGGPIFAAQISADNRSVVFDSFASNLVVDDSNGTADVFVRELRMTPPWAPGTSYQVGNLVSHESLEYRALQAHTSRVGWEPGSVPALWERPTPCGGLAWAPGTRYVAGSRVTFGGQTYEARQTHTSQVGWEPPNAPALWSLVDQPPVCPDNCSGRGICDTSSRSCICNLGTTGETCNACLDGFRFDGPQNRCVLVDDGNFTEWPNPVSRANSDPWLIAHHDDVRLLKPNMLVLLYPNQGVFADMTALVRTISDGLSEGSRAQGFRNPAAPQQLQYQLTFRDLRDGVGGRPPPPPGFPFDNSTLFPRRQVPPGATDFGTLDYARLFSPEYAPHLGFADPDNPGQFLDLCTLISRGLVHEMILVARDPGEVNDSFLFEEATIMPVYTVTGNRIPGAVNRCSNGCVDEDVPFCGHSIHIGFVNYLRGPGCYIHGKGHDVENGIKDNAPSLKEWFIPYSRFDLDTRFGLPFSNFYPCDRDQRCIDFQTPTAVRLNILGNEVTVSPFDPVCGSVHFPPTASTHDDYFNPQEVRTSCMGFGRHGGTDGRDATELIGGAAPLPWNTPTNARFSDCGGEFQVWWYQNMPSHGSGQTFSDGRTMKSIWPYFFY